MEKLTVKELRAKCKEMGITKYSRLKKEFLIIAIQAEEARLEREAKIEAMKDEVRKASRGLEDRYDSLGLEGLASDQFDSYICFAVNATGLKRLDQLKELCDRFLEKCELRNKELDIYEERQEKEHKEMEKIIITEDISNQIGSTMVTKNITCEVKEYENFVYCYRLDEQGNRMQYLNKDLKISINKRIYDVLVADGVIVKITEEKEGKKDMLVDAKELFGEAVELMNGEFNVDYEELNELVFEALQSVNAKKFAELHEADKFDMLYEKISQLLQKEVVEFKPELTAIDTRNSKSAEMIAEVATAETKVLDYGCGTGRNIKYIKNNSAAHVDGCDIPEQLEKEKDKHQKIIDERTVIAPASELENNSYDVVLNSHVLNVIESDEVKKIVVADIFQKLKEGGKAVIEVRTKQDVEGAKTKEKYGDGWKIKKGSSFTYQEGISKEKMINLVSSVGFKIEEHIFNSTRHIIQVVK